MIPEVSGVMSFGKALEEAKKLDVLLIPYERRSIWPKPGGLWVKSDPASP